MADPWHAVKSRDRRRCADHDSPPPSKKCMNPQSPQQKHRPKEPHHATKLHMCACTPFDFRNTPAKSRRDGGGRRRSTAVMAAHRHRRQIGVADDSRVDRSIHKMNGRVQCPRAQQSNAFGGARCRVHSGEQGSQSRSAFEITAAQTRCTRGISRGGVPRSSSAAMRCASPSLHPHPRGNMATKSNCNQRKVGKAINTGCGS